MTTKSDVAFTALRSLMLRLGLIDFIEVGLHYNRAIKLHFYVSTIDCHYLFIPLTNRLEMTFLGSD